MHELHTRTKQPLGISGSRIYALGSSYAPWERGVRTLGSGEPVFGPSERVQVLVEQRVLLLNAEPRTRIPRSVHHLFTRVPVVRL